MLFGRPNLQRTILLALLFGTALLVIFYFTQNSEKYETVVPNTLVIDPIPLSDKDLLEEIQKTSPNLPVTFWTKHQNSGLQLNNSCARFPQLLDLQFNNNNWQTLITSNGTFQLLNAYLDDRKNNKAGPTVRVLGMINRLFPNVTTYCQVWYDDKKYPVIAKTEKYTYVWRKEWIQYKTGDYEAYLISCNVPKNGIPVAVSLVEKECNTATNFLKIIYNKPEFKQDFAVCVKGLDYPHLDITVKLVEWIELLNILGANVIHFYNFSIHPNVNKLLEYYEKLGKIRVTSLQLAGGQPNVPALRSYYLKKKIHSKRVNEVVPYNDCFYQHMHEYKHIILLDIDEVIMPINGTSWKDLFAVIRSTVKEEQSSYSAQNFYFFDNVGHEHAWFSGIPKYMHMLQHVYRSANYTVGAYVKSFFDTEQILTLHNHYPLACLNGCRTYNIDVQHAQLNHYRSDCVIDLKKKCLDIKNNSVMDTSIWRYKETLIKKVNETLKNLNFI